MWLWKISAGVMLHEGENAWSARGYSGNGEGKNNPDMQDVKSVGPIPCGSYTIGPAYTEPYEHKAPPVMHLIPDATNQMFGRDGFLIHGDSVKDPGTASEGCIILPHDVRVKIAESADKKLVVIR